MNDFIQIIGVRTNNLKNFNINIPKQLLIVITGVSGSGKSSLAFDTVYAEGQRRFMESLSIQARQLLDQLPKPDIDSIKGLTPTIAIEQESRNRNPRSTVGTVSEVYHYLRLLFARIGTGGDRKGGYEPNFFSFNSPYGACSSCQGKGFSFVVNQFLIIPDSNKSISQGALEPWNNERDQYYKKLVEKVCSEYSIDLEIPFCDLNENDVKILLHGIEDRKFQISYKNSTGKHRTRSVSFEGVIPYIESRYSDKTAILGSNKALRFMSEITCSECQGYKLNRDSLKVTIDRQNIGQLVTVTITELLAYFKYLPNKLNVIENQIGSYIIPEIIKRLSFLEDIGLGYLTLDRPIHTLSGGELQRVRLATQLSSELSGITYVLDEPSIGLHPRDTERLIHFLKRLLNLGNTVIVVEHDLEIMMQSDWLIDIGPGAGQLGGQLLAEGTPSQIAKNTKSIIGRYLSGRKDIESVQKRREVRNFIFFNGCTAKNLKNIDFKLPLGVLVALSGVSGSGKSTLVNEIILPVLKRNRSENVVRSVNGIENIKNVVKVDQTPIGRSPRSNPATFIGLFDDIRMLFAKLPGANKKHLDKSSFSFNVEGGRCEECQGDGQVSFEMSFLPKLYMTCPVCMGKRYKEEVLQVKYKDLSIFDILSLSILEVMVLFENEISIIRKLTALRDVGLGYLKLGQPATTLSGGEAQRVKLAAELWKKPKNTLYIFDEPTTGLHIKDVEVLLVILQSIVDEGNTVLVIEHNLDLLKHADYVIDMGPEGGEKGGQIISEGPPQFIAQNQSSHTGQFLKKYFK